MPKKALVILLAAFFLTVFISQTRADELLDVQNQINQKNSELSKTQSNLEKIKRDIASLGGSLTGSQAELDSANTQMDSIRKQLSDAETSLEKKRDTLAYLVSIRNKQIRQIYQVPQRTPLELFLSNGDLTGFSENLAYQSSIISDSRSLIKLVNAEVLSMEKTRNEIQSSKDQLEALANQISAKLAAIKNDYDSANSSKNYLTSQVNRINGSLKGLSTKQNQLIAARLAQFSQNQTLGSGVPGSTPLPNPGFSPAYAVGSYGSPHRVGMNQYGAYGRAKVGQDYQTILKAYYANIAVTSYSVPARIDVSSPYNSSLDFEEEYLMKLKEMPQYWPVEALKAQAVAARTYAVKWIQDGRGAICTTQSCQVINDNSAPTQNWIDAVRATRGIVATYNGAPINAWYSSTSGGYTVASNVGFTSAYPYAIGIKDVAAGGSWPTDSFDGPKYGNSPWFHKAWGNSNCGSTYYPWMTKEQVADLFNSILLADKDPAYTSQLNPPDGCYTPPGISFQAVKNALASKGVADVGDIGNIVTGFDNQGKTTTINVVSSTYGLIVFDAFKFYSIFVVRSPGSLKIATSYSRPVPFFDFLICPPTCS